MGCEDLSWQKIASIIASLSILLLFEFWLGRTQKTRASSTLELLLMVGVFCLTIFLKKKEKTND